MGSAQTLRVRERCRILYTNCHSEAFDLSKARNTTIHTRLSSLLAVVFRGRREKDELGSFAFFYTRQVIEDKPFLLTI